MSQTAYKSPPLKGGSQREICINFQTKGCTKKNCKFLHKPKEEPRTEPVEFRPIILSPRPRVVEQVDNMEIEIQSYEDRLFNALNTRKAISRDSAIALDKFLGANNPPKKLFDAGYTCTSVMENNTRRFGFFTFGSEKRVFAKPPKAEAKSSIPVAKNSKMEEVVETPQIEPVSKDLRFEKKIQKVISTLTELKIKNMDCESVARRFVVHEKEPFNQVMQRIHEWMATQEFIFEEAAIESNIETKMESKDELPSLLYEEFTVPEENKIDLTTIFPRSESSEIVSAPVVNSVVISPSFDWELHHLRIRNILLEPFKPIEIPPNLFQKTNEIFHRDLEASLAELRIHFSRRLDEIVEEFKKKQAKSEFNRWFNPTASIQVSPPPSLPPVSDFTQLVANMDESSRRALAAALAATRSQ